MTVEEHGVELWILFGLGKAIAFFDDQVVQAQPGTHES